MEEVSAAPISYKYSSSIRVLNPVEIQYSANDRITAQGMLLGLVAGVVSGAASIGPLLLAPLMTTALSWPSATAGFPCRWEGALCTTCTENPLSERGL